MPQSSLVDIRPGSHVGWMFADHSQYAPIARGLLERGSEQGEKTAVFGPRQGTLLSDLGRHADLSADPWVDFLGEQRFDPEVMYSMFQEQVDEARSQGFRGLRVVADMDWLLPCTQSNEDVLAFEVLLDRVISELGATVVCAYSESSFSRDTIQGILAVHPVACGHEPLFRFVSGGQDTWVLSGEVDFAVASPFATAVAGVSESDDCVIDVANLTFIDVAATRVLAQACADNPSVQFRGVPRCLHRVWEVAGLDQIAELKEVS